MAEYVRASKLSDMSQEKEDRKRAECTKLYDDAANALRSVGGMVQAGE